MYLPYIALDKNAEEIDEDSDYQEGFCGLTITRFALGG